MCVGIDRAEPATAEVPFNPRLFQWGCLVVSRSVSGGAGWLLGVNRVFVIERALLLAELTWFNTSLKNIQNVRFRCIMKAVFLLLWHYFYITKQHSSKVNVWHLRAHKGTYINRYVIAVVITDTLPLREESEPAGGRWMVWGWLKLGCNNDGCFVLDRCCSDSIFWAKPLFFLTLFQRCVDLALL